MTPFSEKQSANNNVDIPEEFLCPITHDLMHRPLMCRSGLSFDRTAILTWISEHNNTCPMTRQPLKPSDLVPNRALEARIYSWCKENDIDYYDPKDLKTRQPEDAALFTCLVSEVDREKKSIFKDIAKSFGQKSNWRFDIRNHIRHDR
jgi:U-box domain